MTRQQQHAEPCNHDVEQQNEMQRTIGLERQEQQVRRIQQSRHPVGEEGNAASVERIPQQPPSAVRDCTDRVDRIGYELPVRVPGWLRIAPEIDGDEIDGTGGHGQERHGES